MRTISNTWQEDAILWLHHRAGEVSALTAEDEPGKPALKACARMLDLVRRHIPAADAPIDIDVTPDHGIELEWIGEGKGLRLCVLADGAIEVTKLVEGITVNEFSLDHPDWRLGQAFAWYENPDENDLRGLRFPGALAR
ncbi:MAG TPA: hypothetical protein VMA09_12400 [Candidatus Binataceae bacterium]|nr:hypothetical protein [Candidatus Binataceae bacterium]